MVPLFQIIVSVFTLIVEPRFLINVMSLTLIWPLRESRLILQKRGVFEKREPLESRASIRFQEIWGHLLDNSLGV
jgi:hypothetical protein